MLKASNAEAGDRFGATVALSGDGATLAVGAFGEASAGVGVDADQSSNSATYSGAVYIFVRSGTSWTQQAYIKASNTEMNDGFGRALALTSDGSTLAVGAPSESSNATGIGGDQTNNSASFSGAVYVFTRAGTTWTQQAYVKASNTDALDNFGVDVELSADGSLLAVAATGEASLVPGDPTNNGALNTGAAYVFARSGTTWTQQAYLKASNPGDSDEFGNDIALSADGSTLAIGALGEDSAATGIDGDQASETAQLSGAVYVFAHAGSSWTQQAYVKPSVTRSGMSFGFSVALSATGARLAVGAPGEASAATGVGGDQNDTSASAAGAIYTFTRDGTSWRQEAYLKASNTGAADGFGLPVALSADGVKLACAAQGEDSAAAGFNGNQQDDTLMNAGAVYLDTRVEGWTQSAYVKASNPAAVDGFGEAVAVSADASVLVVGTSNQASGTGVVYVFE